MITLIEPDWPAPENVHVYCSTRDGGQSNPPYDSLNLAMHVNDNEQVVAANRQALAEQLKLPAVPCWLTQTHSDIVINAKEWQKELNADGCYSDRPGVVCAVQVADCLPVIFTDTQGSQIMAVHAGWRGLEQNILVKALRKHWFGDAKNILAWFGPCICAQHYEVDANVYDAFVSRNRDFIKAFSSSGAGHWWCDLRTIAKMQLNAFGVSRISVDQHCTYEDDALYSHRKEQPTGRQAVLAWTT